MIISQKFSFHLSVPRAFPLPPSLLPFYPSIHPFAIFCIYLINPFEIPYKDSNRSDGLLVAMGGEWRLEDEDTWLGRMLKGYEFKVYSSIAFYQCFISHFSTFLSFFILCEELFDCLSLVSGWVSRKDLSEIFNFQFFIENYKFENNLENIYQRQIIWNFN